MTAPPIGHNGAVLSIGETTVELDYAIHRAWQVHDVVVVLFDPDANLRRFGQFPNLIAVDLNGEQVWEAELPTTYTGDHFYDVVSENPIVVLSFQSFTCQIDPATGRIVDKVFTK